MRVFVDKMVYDRTKEQAKSLQMTVSMFVEEALIKVLGMEGIKTGRSKVIPLDEDEIFGGCGDKGKDKIVKPGAS